MRKNLSPSAVFASAQSAWDNMAPPDDEAPLGMVPGHSLRMSREAWVYDRGVAIAVDPTREQFADALGALLAPDTVGRLLPLWRASGTSHRARQAFDVALYDAICCAFDDMAESEADALPLDGREVLDDWE